MRHTFKFCVIVISAALGMGDRALAQCALCSTANNNTTVGTSALSINTSGGNNTAVGFETLAATTSGSGNTAVGFESLAANTTGNYNTAIGYQAFAANTSGGYSTAIGTYALQLNTTGGYNTAFGAFSLPNNASGTANTAFGYGVLRSNTVGSNNIAFGFQALYSDATGSSNIAIGDQAAYLVTGSNTIEIGTQGAAGDNGVIRIGAPGTQKATYIAGISGAQVTGSAVYVTSSGQLGVLASSERYKMAIEPMGAGAEKIQQLQPVTFHLKTDPNGPIQYGLIAEQVAKVYPELVIRDEAGTIQGVRYEELTPMLLSQVQQQAAEIRDLKQQQGKYATESELKDLRQQLQAALVKLQAEGELVAKR